MLHFLWHPFNYASHTRRLLWGVESPVCVIQKLYGALVHQYLLLLITFESVGNATTRADLGEKTFLLQYSDTAQTLCPHWINQKLSTKNSPLGLASMQHSSPRCRRTNGMVLQEEGHDAGGHDAGGQDPGGRWGEGGVELQCRFIIKEGLTEKD